MKGHKKIIFIIYIFLIVGIIPTCVSYAADSSYPVINLHEDKIVYTNRTIEINENKYNSYILDGLEIKSDEGTKGITSLEVHVDKGFFEIQTQNIPQGFRVFGALKLDKTIVDENTEILDDRYTYISLIVDDSIRGDYSKVKNFLKDIIFYHPIDSVHEISITGEMVDWYNNPSNVIAYNSHYYNYITSDKKNYVDAYNETKKMKFNGLRGYLATVTNENEHNYIYAKIGKENDRCGWIGNARSMTNLNYCDTQDITEKLDFTTHSLDWYWICGPEAGQKIGSIKKLGSSSNVDNFIKTPGVYSNWSESEPNAAGYSTNIFKSVGEYGYGPSGRWNDNKHNEKKGYYVEFSSYNNGMYTGEEYIAPVSLKTNVGYKKAKNIDTSDVILSRGEGVYGANISNLDVGQYYYVVVNEEDKIISVDDDFNTNLIISNLDVSKNYQIYAIGRNTIPPILDENIREFAGMSNIVYNKCQIVLDYKGGIDAEGNSLKMLVGSLGEPLIAEEPKKDGADFKGWKTSIDENTYDALPNKYTHSFNKVTYTAMWKLKDVTYAVKYYKEKLDGTGYTEVVEDTKNLIEQTDTNVRVEDIDPEYSTKYVGFMVNDKVTDSKLDGIVTGDGNLILKIFYDRNKYDVSFNANGGSEKPGNQEIEYEGHINKPIEPIKHGYDLDGWIKPDGSEWDFNNDIVTGEVNLEAKWTARTDTPWKIEYYKDGVKSATSNFTGTTDTIAKVSAKDAGYISKYEGYEYNSGKSVIVGTIFGNGSLVLKVYYDKKSDKEPETTVKPLDPQDTDNDMGGTSGNIDTDKVSDNEKLKTVKKGDKVSIGGEMLTAVDKDKGPLGVVVEVEDADGNRHYLLPDYGLLVPEQLCLAHLLIVIVALVLEIIYFKRRKKEILSVKGGK